MSEYLCTLQGIKQSIEELLSSESQSVESVEIQESAQSLKKSIQPCLEEIKLSANRLKDLMQVCFQDLDHAEDVWQSKQRIAEASKREIWEQLGELTGCHIKINQLGEQYKIEITQLTEDLLNKTIEEIRQQYFIDPKTQQQRQAVGWGDKDAFNKGIRPKIQSFSEQLEHTISEGTSLFYKRVVSILISNLYNYAKISDKKNKTNLKSKINYLIEATKSDLDQMGFVLHNHQTIGNTNILLWSKLDLDNWQKKFGDITWKEVLDFHTKVLQESKNRINLILNNRVSILKEVLDNGIQFYNDLLEKQNRYQQESPEQYISEKTWIDQQRQTLENIQTNLEKIID